MEVLLSQRQAVIIRQLLRQLGQPVPVDLVNGLNIADAEEYIEHLKTRVGVVIDR